MPTDPAPLVGHKNLYMITDLGLLDILSEITGVGSYEEVSGHTITVSLGNADCRVLDLENLIRAKRVLKLPKDRQAAIELEAIREHIVGRGRLPAIKGPFGQTMA